MGETDVAKDVTGGGSDREDRLGAIEAHVAKLDETVEVLAATVQRLAVGQRRGPVEPVASDRGVEARELVVWVSWLVERYELGAVLPACWPRHGALVEELDALRVGWRDMIGAGQGGTAAAQWHDLFSRALDRIERRWRTCIDGTHRPKMLARWLEDGAQGADDIDLARDRFPLG